MFWRYNLCRFIQKRQRKNENVFKNAQEFIYRYARPLDMALWRYHFEGGSRNEVMDILSYYQNEDGGFGHAIEPDCWNNNSTAIGTWKAISVLREVGIDANNTIVKKILAYLESGIGVIDGMWCFTEKSNNDFPHAIWWECQNGLGDPDDNPTISLAGFALKYADKKSKLYKRAVDIVTERVNKFIKEPICDMHTTRIYLELYEYCLSIDGFDLFDLAACKSALYSAVQKTVCEDSNKWFTEYVCKPSMFYSSSKLIFEILDRKLCKKEGELLLNMQQSDGSYNVTWLWYNDYTEYYVAANWWKSSMLITNMRYLKDLNLI